MERAILQLPTGWEARRKLPQLRRQVEEHPVDPETRRRVRVVHDQGEGTHSVGHPAPAQGRREIFPLPAVLAGDPAAVGEGITAEVHRASTLVPILAQLTKIVLMARV